LLWLVVLSCAPASGPGAVNARGIEADVLSAPIPPRAHRPPRGAAPDVEMVPQLGHSSDVWTLDVSPDGRLVASAGLDRIARIWHLETGMLVRQLQGHTQPIGGVAFSHDGRWLATGSQDRTARIWEAATGKTVRVLPTGCDSRALTFARNDTELVVAGCEGDLRVFETATGNELPRVRATDKQRAAVTFAQGGRTAVFTLSSARIEVWDVEGRRRLHDIDANGPGGVRTAYLSPDGRTAVVDRNGPEMAVWDIASGRMTRPMTGVSGEAFVWSPDGKRGVSASFGLRIWDMADGKLLRAIESGSEALAVRFAADGRRVIVAGRSRGIEVWDTETGLKSQSFRGRADAVTSVAVDARMGALYASQKAGIQVWSLSTLGLSRIIPRPEQGQVLSLALSEDGATLAYVHENRDVMGKHLAIANAATGEVRAELEAATGPVAISADGSVVIAGDYSAAVVYDVARGAVRAKLQGHGNTVNAVAVSRDQMLVATGGLDGTARVWDARTGAPVASLKDEEFVNAVAFSSNGKLLATGGWTCEGMDNCGRFRAHVWDLANKTQLRTFVGHTDELRSVAFSPDSARIATASRDGTVRVFRVEDGTTERTITHHADGVTSVGFSSDGRFLVTGSDDATARVTSLATGESVALAASGAEWIAYDLEGYFDASKHGGDLVGAVRGIDAFRVEQVAVRNNRPDFLLEGLGLGSPDLLDHYWARYVRRLRKLHLDPDVVDRRFAKAPTAAIVSLEARNGVADVDADLASAESELRAYSVWVNDVPVRLARPIAGPRARVHEHIELESGTNRIEIAALDATGAESLRAYRAVDQPQAAQRDLYFLGFGVSHYKNEKLDLGYAHKDAQDLAELFKLSHGFGRVHARALVDAEVTNDAIRVAKTFFAPARVDDIAVVFVAGHGAHARDASANYYFVTHATDVARLAQTAAPFELIEGLFQDIAPRKKLMLLDTCESGERDDDVLAAPLAAAAASRGIRARGTRALVLEGASAPKPRPWLLERERFIYNDLERRTGAIVFASSRGNELSYEYSDLQNGAFTSALKAALTTESAAADTNHDGVVSNEELRAFVSAAVAKRTDGRQHPTIDRDNPDETVRLPVVK
jgi:WD40 repeat protein